MQGSHGSILGGKGGKYMIFIYFKQTFFIRCFGSLVFRYSGTLYTAHMVRTRRRRSIDDDTSILLVFSTLMSLTPNSLLSRF